MAGEAHMLWTALTIAALILAALLAWGVRSVLGFVLSAEPVDEPFEKQFVPAGIAHLPYAIALSGEAFRWHGADRVHAGAEFPRMFEDGPWKWDAQGRFAGKDLNCGHYFGLSLEAATEEAAHYGIERDRSVLLRLELESNRILDLTHPRFIRKTFETHIGNHELVSDSYYSMLSELIELGKGGNPVTDFIGIRARRSGYHGIMFFSARTMEELRVWGYNRNLEPLFSDWDFRDLRATRKHLNVVFFSGAQLVSCTRAFRIGDGAQAPNPCFGRDPAEILGMLEHGEDYQEAKSSAIILRGAPCYEPGRARWGAP